jgi:hypothetical protein
LTVLIGLGREVLRQLEKDLTTEHLHELNDEELKQLAEQLWHWHDTALRELIKRGHVVSPKK